MTRGRKPKSDAIRRGISDAYAIQAASGDAVGLAIPEDIAHDAVKARFWEWIAPPTNRFTEQDMPLLRLLVGWHAKAEQAEAEDDVRTMKQASTEIRALSDMLGLSPLARSRIGLLDATTVKTAADTAAIFGKLDDVYDVIEAEYEAH